MVVSRRWGWIALATLLSLLASAPLWLTLPVPAHALAIDHAQFTGYGAAPVQVTLPHVQGRHRARGRYRMVFELEQAPVQQLYLFIPTLSYRAIIALDGDVVLDTGTTFLIPGITLGVSAWCRCRVVTLPLAIMWSTSCSKRQASRTAICPPCMWAPRRKLRLTTGSGFCCSNICA